MAGGAPVVVPLTSEELACLLYLAGEGGMTSVLGVVGFSSIDEPGFDVGLRGLLVRDLVVIGADGPLLTGVVRDVARLLTHPEHIGYLTAVEQALVETVLVTGVGDRTAVVVVRAEGAFIVGVRPTGIVDALVNILVEQTPNSSAIEWPLGVRWESLGAAPVDIAINAERRTLMVDGNPFESTDVEIRRRLVETLTPPPRTEKF